MKRHFNCHLFIFFPVAGFVDLGGYLSYDTRKKKVKRGFQC